MEEKKNQKTAAKVIWLLFVNAVRLNKSIWKDRPGQVFLMLAVYLVTSVLPFAQTGVLALIINELVNLDGDGSTTRYIVWLLMLLVGVSVLVPVLMAVKTYIDDLFWYYLQIKMEIRLLQKRGEIDVATHENPDQANLLNRVNENGAWRMRAFFNRNLYIFENILGVILASAVVLTLEWWVFLVIVFGTLPELLAEGRHGRRSWNTHSEFAETRRHYSNLRRHFVDLGSLIELKLFQNLKHFAETIRYWLDKFLTQERLNDRWRFHAKLLTTISSQASIGFATVWFVLEVINGSMQIGTLTFVLGAIASLQRSLSRVFGNLGAQYQESLFVSDVFEVLDTEEVVKKRIDGWQLPKDWTPEIVFENVSFKYPGTDTLILKDINLSIKPGEKLAIVGINGAGKTTFVKLLCRFYDPTAGRILIDGHDLKDIDLPSWYQSLGAIFQDYAHYHLRVKEAVAIGRTDHDLDIDAVKSAARAGEANAFIEQWKEGYEQMLGKSFTDGVEPSVGQWQKLALARVFYRDPNVLVLDEPTASIDAEAEAKVFERLEALPSDRTVILISHRFSTVRKANKIAVIEGGRLSEYGTHEKLLNDDKTYARLFRLQAKGYQ